MMTCSDVDQDQVPRVTSMSAELMLDGLSFGDAIKVLMQRHGLNPGELANRLGMDRGQICRWIEGSHYPRFRSANRVHSLEQVFGLAAGALSAKVPLVPV